MPTDPISHYLLILWCCIQYANGVSDVTVVERRANYLVVLIAALVRGASASTILQVEALSQVVVTDGIFRHDRAGLRVGASRRNKPCLVVVLAMVAPPNLKPVIADSGLTIVLMENIAHTTHSICVKVVEHVSLAALALPMLH